MLAEPTRRALFDYVRGRDDAVGRDDAAEALGIGRPLAAFHLDRLAGAGLLDVEYRRRSGRVGPGAGRPAKLYRRAHADVAVSLPPRRYDLAAQLLAGSIDPADEDTTRTLLQAARVRGASLADPEGPANGPAVAAPTGGLLDVLRAAGFEPREADEPGGPVIRLRNCPFEALAQAHRPLICAMNLALLEGVAGRFEGMIAEADEAPGSCCVRLRATPATAAARAPASASPESHGPAS